MLDYKMSELQRKALRPHIRVVQTLIQERANAALGVTKPQHDDGAGISGGVTVDGSVIEIHHRAIIESHRKPIGSVKPTKKEKAVQQAIHSVISDALTEDGKVKASLFDGVLPGRGFELSAMFALNPGS